MCYIVDFYSRVKKWDFFLFFMDFFYFCDLQANVKMKNEKV